MAHPPVVALALRQYRHPLKPCQGQHAHYIDAITAAGGVPLCVPQHLDAERLRVLYERSDALLLAGGPDVEPHRYGATPDPACNLDVETGLDDTEFPLLEWALADERPILAICRGLQVLNVAMGGTLWQDLAVERPGSLDHSDEDRRQADIHTVSIVPGSHLHELTGALEMGVNSIHHQGIRDLAPGLSAVAHAPDGLIEAVEAPDHRHLAAVQWHPEELRTARPWAAAMFDELIAAASTARV